MKHSGAEKGPLHHPPTPISFFDTLAFGQVMSRNGYEENVEAAASWGFSYLPDKVDEAIRTWNPRRIASRYIQLF